MSGSDHDLTKKGHVLLPFTFSVNVLRVQVVQEVEFTGRTAVEPSFAHKSKQVIGWNETGLLPLRLRFQPARLQRLALGLAGGGGSKVVTDVDGLTKTFGAQIIFGKKKAIKLCPRPCRSS